MRNITIIAVAAAMLSTAAAQADGHLTERQMRELVAFSINAGMGFAVRPEHIETPDSIESVYRSVASALGVIGQRCDEVVHIEPPESGTFYDVVCRIGPDSEMTTTYVVNTVASMATER
jgi:hypothetical protein